MIPPPPLSIGWPQLQLVPALNQGCPSLPRVLVVSKLDAVRPLIVGTLIADTGASGRDLTTHPPPHNQYDRRWLGGIG